MISRTNGYCNIFVSFSFVFSLFYFPILSNKLLQRNFLFCRFFVLNTKQAFKIDNEKELRRRALETLQEEREAKRQRIMANKESIDNAIKAWRYYANKIEDLGKVIADEAKFDALTLAGLRCKLSNLQMLQKSLVEKDQLLNQLTNETGTASEHDELLTKCEVMESAMYERIEKLMEKTAPVVSAGELQNAIAAASDKADHVKTENAIAANQKPSAEEMGISWGFFNGNLNDWSKFSTAFIEKVHNDDSLNDAQKLVLLQRSCIEIARDVVVSAGNDYTAVWTRMREMYGESYMILHYTLHKVQSLTTLTMPSYNGIKYLKANAEKCMKVLNTISMDESFGPFMMIMLAAKLDDDSARAWDRKRTLLAEHWVNAANQGENREKARHVPSWAEFLKFLNDECDVYIKQGIRQQIAGPSRVSVGNQPGTSGTGAQRAIAAASASTPSQTEQANRPIPPSQQERRMAPIDMQCSLCPYIHTRYNCEMFKAMTMEQRWSNAEQDGLCVRCLRKYHGRNPCTNKTNNKNCEKCLRQYGKTVYHNSALCNVVHGNINEQPRSGNSPADDDWNNC